MASAVSSYALYSSTNSHKMHPESSAAAGAEFQYEAYSTYTAAPAQAANSKKQSGADANANADRSLTISTTAPVANASAPTKKPTTIKKPAASEASEDSISDNDSSTKGGERADHLKPRLCTVPGCKKRVRSKGLCKAHGGGRRCMVEGCERSSQGQGLCIRHGGGKRCTQPGCTKASQSNGLCKAHGGGLRCMAGNCTKSSQGGGFCRAHGGGQRCEKEGCNKGAQRGGFCAGHGGSRFCQHPDCTKNDRGGGYCAEHGGGKRCDQQGCNKPARKKGKCSYHANANKQKVHKDATAAVAPPMMDMRQITAPTAAYGMPGMPPASKEMTGMRDTMDQHPAIRAYPPVSSYQPRVDMDQRYSKGYEQQMPTSNPYMPVHADQRGYDMGMSQVAPRHYMDAANLPSVSAGYSAPHKHQPTSASMAGMERSASPYNPAARHAAHPSHMGHPAHPHPAYSQHWSGKDAPAQNNGMPDRANMDYFDMKDQNAAPHHAYGASAAYSHHHHMSESAYANQRENYYQQQQQQQQHPASAGNEPSTNSNMMYGSYGYQSHQMHNMNLL